ncbi:hypothetical protein F0224_25550 [Vibrio coralliilyticus]|uniref:hypothetical protein n=1 Tax=Vibrio coralliilyticus TaxID=190893 RepID=UPI000BAC2261|nr:hypothetical protein [Vibrio coralliilyticus]NOI79009.1 hypothetical protein [Vibrio coralliilyticus]PAW00234.1 hypothetical protein CKJ79_27985 [Vibrio coralliilyticus]
MTILAIWFIVFVLSIKPLVSKSRQYYRTRTKNSSNGFKTIILSISAHIGFTYLIYTDVGESWLYWLLPLANIMFVVQVLLVLNLALDYYDVVDKARVSNNAIFGFSLAYLGAVAMLYYSVYINDAILKGICVTAASVGLTGRLITYRNVRD